MRPPVAHFLMAGVFTAALVGCGKQADSIADKGASDAKAVESAMKEKEAKDTAIDAYVYAYPLVTMELTRRALTNVAAPEGTLAPVIAGQKERLVVGDLKLENGWFFSTKMGVYDTNYRQRALVTWIGLGANRPQDAVYPFSEGPDILEKYSGAEKYVMHFNKGEMPPADYFWSLTMYDASYFFVPNALNRYT